MTTSFTKTLRILGFAAAVTLSFAASIDTSHAQVATAEQRAACTPDAFRLCSSEIPNVSAITACMRKKRESLSPACKAVFPR